MPPFTSKNSNSRQYVWLWKKEKKITDGTARNKGNEQEQPEVAMPVLREGRLKRSKGALRFSGFRYARPARLRPRAIDVAAKHGANSKRHHGMDEGESRNAGSGLRLPSWHHQEPWHTAYNTARSAISRATANQSAHQSVTTNSRHYE